MQHIMLDLETMGTGPTAAIVAIGAVEFDLDEGITGRTFYTAIDLVSAVKSGGTLDASTIIWWMKQADTARKEITDGPKIPHDEALWRFSSWINTVCANYVWGNGVDFDNVILANAYKRINMPAQWRYSHNRCYRTLKALYPDIEMNREGVYHHALDDAVNQARHLIRIYDYIRRDTARTLEPSATP